MRRRSVIFAATAVLMLVPVRRALERRPRRRRTASPTRSCATSPCRVGSRSTSPPIPPSVWRSHAGRSSASIASRRTTRKWSARRRPRNRRPMSAPRFPCERGPLATLGYPTYCANVVLAELLADGGGGAARDRRLLRPGGHLDLLFRPGLATADIRSALDGAGLKSYAVAERKGLDTASTGRRWPAPASGRTTSTTRRTTATVRTRTSARRSGSCGTANRCDCGRVSGAANVWPPVGGLFAP